MRIITNQAYMISHITKNLRNNIPTWMLSCGFFLIGALCPSRSEAQTTTSETSTTFTVAAMNVDGMPREILGMVINDDAKEADGATKIGQKMAEKDYDFIGLSEDFNFHDELIAPLEGIYSCGTHRGRLKASNLADVVLKKGMETDGLGFLWRTGITATDESWTMWTVRNGLTSNGNDELIQKGFRHYTVTVANSVVVDVFEVHMDADVAAEDIAARESQMAQLAADIQQNYDNNRPKLVIGDTNCRYTRDYLKTKFIDIVAENGKYTVGDAWVEYCKGGTYPTYGIDALMVSELGYVEGEIVDKIIYMNPTSSSATKLTLNWFKVDTDFNDEDGAPLADHYPVVANFTATVPTFSSTPADHWTWKGETVEGGGSYYMYSAGLKGFIRSNYNGLPIDPNDATMWQLTAQSGSNQYSAKCTTDDYWLCIKSGFVEKTGETTFKFISSTTTDGAYKLQADAGTFWKNRYLNFDNEKNVWSERGAETASTNNDWLFITSAQKLAYDRYVAVYNKAVAYLNTLPIDETVKSALADLLDDDTDWTQTTTEDIEALNEKIENWMSDQTSLVSNPSFELGDKLSQGNVQGWTVNSDATQTFITAVVDGDEGEAIRKFSPIDGNYVFYTNGGSPSDGYYCKQIIKDLPEGYYTLTATFASDSYNSVNLLFDDKATVTTPSMFDRTYGRTVTAVAYWQGGDCTISAQSSTWFEVDNFLLKKFDYYYDLNITEKSKDANTSKYYATLCLPYNANVSAGLKLWYAEKINDETVRLKTFPDGTILEAETPVVISADVDGTYRFMRTESQADITNVADNLLYGTPYGKLTDKDENTTYYVFANKSKGVGFYVLANDTAIPQYKAYLKVANSDAKQYALEFDDNGQTTTIDVSTKDFGNVPTIEAIYSASGARLSGLQRGVNIVKMSNGMTKKIIVK